MPLKNNQMKIITKRTGLCRGTSENVYDELMIPGIMYKFRQTLKRDFTVVRICLLAIILSETVITGYAQSLADSLQKRFHDYRTRYATEKIYVHTDQELYLTGETLWFKLYIVDASLHKPADLSKVAYLEILDKANQPVLQSKVAVQNGFGSGSLFIPASITAGNYTFRAYTSWMKNFDPGFFFQKAITVVNPFKKLELDKSKKTAAIDLQFFPEGGNLVYGLKSKVAFRGINAAGKGVDLTGFVLGDNNDTITVFKTYKFGMGSFEFTPVAGHSYKAVAHDESGRAVTYKLPEIKDSGYVLAVKDSTKDLLSVTISHSLSTIPTEGVYLFIHTRNMVSIARQYYLPRNRTVIAVPKGNIPGGISHVTLFDSNLNPVCERLVFQPVRDRLLFDIKASQTEFGIRRKVMMDITSKNLKNEPQPANVSIAVVRVDSLQRAAENDILSYLFIESDLIGSVESPEFYTHTDEPGVMQSLDNVMLTHGWRRFVWNDIIARQKHDLLHIPEFRGHIIRGKVTDPSGAPKYGVLTYLSSPSRNIQIYGSSSNAMGDVQFEMKDFNGPRKIIFQTNTEKDSTSRIQILNPFSGLAPTVTLPPFSLSSALEKELTSRSIGMQIQDIFYQEKNFQFVAGTNDTTAFYGKADATYYLDDYTRFPLVEEVMREYVPGVLVRKRKDGFHFMNLDVVNKRVFDEDPMVLLDGIPVFDIDDIMAFDPLKIKKLEVLTRRIYNGVIAMPGIVSYTTYTGDLSGFQLDPRVVSLDYEGLQLRREFYSPKYDTPKQRDSRMPDQRMILYWSPNVLTDQEGKQHIEFYSSDLTGEYRVVIEGLTSEGLAGSGKHTFSVRPYDN